MFIKQIQITCNIYESYLEANEQVINFINKINYKKGQMLSTFHNLDEKNDSEFKDLFKELYSEWVVQFLKKSLQNFQI